MRRCWHSMGEVGAVTLLAVAAATSALAAAPALYLGVLTAVGAPRPRPRVLGTPPTTRFALLVPAHNEALGIGTALDSFRALDYPSHLYSVHVVADNCSDATADVVRAHGWQAHERNDPTDPGKGPALNWLYDRLNEQQEPFDAMVVVDADSSLDQAFLRAMDAALSSGAVAAQGYYGVRDAHATPGTAFRSAALGCRHHLRPMGRKRLGASCGLYGNGMVFRRELMAGRRWSGHLVEDAEFQMQLLLDGHLVTYVPEALLWAEMPHEIEDATSQNQRWERGRHELIRAFVPVLVRRALTDRRHRVAKVDAVLDHLVPPLSVLAAVQLVATGLAAAGTAAGHSAARRLLMIDIAAILLVALHVVGGLYAVRAPRTVYRHLLSAPKVVVWKIGVWSSVARSRDVAWTRTRRNVEQVA